MKKLLLLFLIILVGYSTGGISASISIDASAAILMEKESQRILYGKNIHSRFLTASISKILTAIVALENGDLEKYYVVDNKTIKQDGSSLYLELGDKIKLIDLIYGLMLRSGNDAAYLIAISVGEDYEKFVYLMNETAKRIGMKESSFSNPSGLDEDGGNFSTAYDMAILMAYALNNEDFRKITASKKYVSKTFENKILYFVNKHRLVQSINYVTGGKTGYTIAARRTLVTSALLNNMELIVVTFNCSNDWQAHKNLLNYGYNNYQLVTLIHRQIIKVNDYLYPATPMINDDIKYPIRREEKLVCIIYLLKKPYNNLIVGKATLYLDGVVVLKINISRYY